MGDFFKPWRRKIAALTFVFLMLLMGISIRSNNNRGEIVLIPGKYFLQSQDGALSVVRSEYIPIAKNDGGSFSGGFLVHREVVRCYYVVLGTALAIFYCFLILIDLRIPRVGAKAL